MHTNSSNSTPGRPHSSNSIQSCMPRSTLPSILQKRHAPNLHQHPKLHQTAPPNSTPLHPAVNLVRVRPHRHRHSQNSTCTITPNCMPKSTRSILTKLCPHRHLYHKQLPKQHTLATSAPPTARPLAPSRPSRKSRSPLH